MGKFYPEVSVEKNLKTNVIGKERSVVGSEEMGAAYVIFVVVGQQCEKMKDKKNCLTKRSCI